MNDLMLPLGSVLRIKGESNDSLVMVIRRLILADKIYDYEVVILPNPQAEQSFGINESDIESVVFIGYEYFDNDIFNDFVMNETILKLKLNRGKKSEL